MTGADGFIGSHLAEMLMFRGAEISSCQIRAKTESRVKQ